MILATEFPVGQKTAGKSKSRRAFGRTNARIDERVSLVDKPKKVIGWNKIGPMVSREEPVITEPPNRPGINRKRNRTERFFVP